MKVEWKLMLGLGLFMLPLGILYAIAGGLTSGIETAGTILLIVVAIAFMFIGVYLMVQSRRMDGLRPEDYDAVPSDGQGEVGSFPASSIWPLMGALAAVLISYGLVFTTFLVVPGIGLLVTTVVGMARESDVSELGHADLDHANHTGVPSLPTFSDQVKK